MANNLMVEFPIDMFVFKNYLPKNATVFDRLLFCLPFGKHEQTSFKVNYNLISIVKPFEKEPMRPVARF